MKTNLINFSCRGLLAAALLSLAACGQPAPDATVDTTTSTQYDLSLNMLSLMNTVLEPVADSLWQSAGWVLSEEDGYQELYPTNDEEWLRMYNQSALIVEIGNMLTLPERAQGRENWLTYAKATSTVGLLAMKATQEQNQEDFFQAGAQLYSVCTACHQAYNTELSRFVSN